MYQSSWYSAHAIQMNLAELPVVLRILQLSQLLYVNVGTTLRVSNTPQFVLYSPYTRLSCA
jgi:hypothetical protein